MQILKSSEYAPVIYESPEWQKYVTTLKMDIFQCRHEHHIAKAIGRTFTEETARQLYALLDLSVNPLKKIIKATSTLYNTPPTRKFFPPNETLDTIYKGLKFDKFMSGLQIIANTVNDVLVLVTWDIKYKKVRLQLFHCANCEVETNEFYPEEIEEFEFKVGKDGKICVEWTAEEIEVESGGKEQKQPNPYEKIPIAKLSTAPFNEGFWNTTYGNELAYATLAACVDVTDSRYSAIMAAFKMLFSMDADIMAGEQEAASDSNDIGAAIEQGTIEVGPGKIITASTRNSKEHQGQVGVLNMEQNLANHTDFIDTGVRRIENTYGITGEVAAAAPGVALKIRQSALEVLRNEQAPLYKDFESELLALIIMVWNQANPTQTISAETTVDVVFSPVRWFSSEAEKLEFYKSRHAAFLDSSATFVQNTLDIKETEQEAADRLRENAAVYREIYNVPSILGE